MDWVLQLPCNPCVTNSSESPWRTLEAGIRMADVWPAMFYRLQDSDAFNTSARVMMLLGFSEHGRVLQLYGTAGVANWRMQQWSGLVDMAVAFPELINSSVWFQVGIQGLEKELVTEVYPDGVENEETASYHLMAANNFFTVLQTLRLSGASGEF